MNTAYPHVLTAVILLFIWFVSPVEFASATDTKDMVARIHAFTDQQLMDRLSELLSKDQFVGGRYLEYEVCLTEIERRRSDKLSAHLQKQYHQVMKRLYKRYHSSGKKEPGGAFNLELLTALRRSKKQPAPLTIQIEQQDDRLLKATPWSLPALNVSIKNTDIERQAVRLRIGGNYRTGRPTRWRIVLTDESGKVVPVKRNSMPGDGGFVRYRFLAYGQSRSKTLPMHQFIDPLPAGRYQLQVLYHNSRAILDMENISGLVLSKSATIPFIVSPQALSADEEQNRKVRRLIEQLPATKEVKIVGGSYGEWAHDFVAPDTVHGKLLSLGLNAAPMLLEAVQKETSIIKRGWLLALLYSATSVNDMWRTQINTSYDSIEGPWDVQHRSEFRIELEQQLFAFSLSRDFGPLEKWRVSRTYQKRLKDKWESWIKDFQAKIVLE